MRSIIASILLVFSLGSAHAAVDTYVDTFAGGSNAGGWSWAGPTTYPTSGGNPDDYVRGVVDTYAPRLISTAPSSPFTGNYRKTRVTEIGVDLNTIAMLYGQFRECTLILWNGTAAVYRLGTEQVPQVGSGWQSYHIPVPSKSLTMPAGWSVYPGSSVLLPSLAWNNVIQNVTRVDIFFGDPKLFYIFATWTVGADNVSITRDTGTARADNLDRMESVTDESDTPRDSSVAATFPPAHALREEQKSSFQDQPTSVRRT